MRNITKSLVAAIVLAFTLGCSSVDARFAQSIKASTDLILPDYVAYVDSDPRLDEDSKEIRRNNAYELDRLLNEAASK